MLFPLLHFVSTGWITSQDGKETCGFGLSRRVGVIGYHSLGEHLAGGISEGDGQWLSFWLMRIYVCSVQIKTWTQVYTSLLFLSSLSPHSIPPANPSCARPDLQVQNQSLPLLSCFSHSFALYWDMGRGADLDLLCYQDSCLYILYSYRFNKHRRSSVSTGAKHCYIHHPYGGGYARVVVLSLVSLLLSSIPTCRAGNHLSIFSQCLAGCWRGGEGVAAVRRWASPCCALLLFAGNYLLASSL